MITYSTLKANLKISPKSLGTLNVEAVPRPPRSSLCEDERHIDLKRKRVTEAQSTSNQEGPADKRVQRWSTSVVGDNRLTAEASENTKLDPIEYWSREGVWPQEFFESRITMDQFTRKKSQVSSGGPGAEDDNTLDIEDKSAVYKDPSYEPFLAENGSFLDESSQGVLEDSIDQSRALLRIQQIVPSDSATLFRDDVFFAAVGKLRNRNEARVINDIARLMVPSAETLVIFGAVDLDMIIVGLNERWNESVPLTQTARRPQPDFTAGFRRTAFSTGQLKKLEPLIGNVYASRKMSSLLLATWRMYFPCFTCEVKCGQGGLDIADKQNANSMTLAVRGLVKLFRLVNRETELHRRILGISMSHDDKSVRIYGHYPIIDKEQTTFYRHKIESFDFTGDGGKEKWTAYRFTVNVYRTFMPAHHRLICSAIDALPVGSKIGASPVTQGDRENESETQETMNSASMSKDGGRSKKARLSSMVLLRNELDELKVQREQERKDNLQRHQELIDLHRQDSERQRQEGERQRREMKEENNALQRQISQLMSMLGAQSISNR